MNWNNHWLSSLLSYFPLSGIPNIYHLHSYPCLGTDSKLWVFFFFFNFLVHSFFEMLCICILKFISNCIFYLFCYVFWTLPFHFDFLYILTLKDMIVPSKSKLRVEKKFFFILLRYRTWYKTGRKVKFTKNESLLNIVYNHRCQHYVLLPTLKNHFWMVIVVTLPKYVFIFYVKKGPQRRKIILSFYQYLHLWRIELKTNFKIDKRKFNVVIVIWPLHNWTK